MTLRLDDDVDTTLSLGVTHGSLAMIHLNLDMTYPRHQLQCVDRKSRAMTHQQ